MTPLEAVERTIPLLTNRKGETIRRLMAAFGVSGKYCRHCGHILDRDAFYRDRHTRDGRKALCRDCWRVAQALSPAKASDLKAQLRSRGVLVDPDGPVAS